MRSFVERLKPYVAPRLLAAVLAAFTFSWTGNSAAADNLSAFRNFVATGAYDNADFYLKNKLVEVKTLDTSQMFFDVFMEKYSNDVTTHAQQIAKLYDYLNALAPIDLNKTMTCERSRRNGTCLLVSNLFTGAPRSTISFFVERGLDLNKRVPNIIPATLPMALRMGVIYSIDDLNYFVSKGMVLGDELYPIQELSAYDENSGDRLNLPGNYLSLSDQNLLDILVIALGSQVHTSSYVAESMREKTLCDFIAYAAPSFSPSFDYLLYLLQSREQFRGVNIGKMEKYGRQIYQPFPTSCVSLVQSMAASHSRLDTVISQFASEGDIDTANWLISIKQGKN